MYHVVPVLLCFSSLSFFHEFPNSFYRAKKLVLIIPSSLFFCIWLLPLTKKTSYTKARNKYYKFVGHMAFIKAIPLCLCPVKAALDNN